jgi:ADP-ribosylglycohydrolase
VDQIRPTYAFDISCQGTLPAAIACFVDADSFEDAVRNAVSLGGDSDTLACIAGAMAAAFCGGVPAGIRQEVRARLAPDLWAVVEEFEAAFPG